MRYFTTETLSVDVKRDKYTDYVASAYDIDVDRVQSTIRTFTLPKNEWNIGVIYGASGSGKTTLLRSIGPIHSPSFDSNKSVIANFDFITPEEAARVLTSVGLASVPTWLKPHPVLSNGERFRADLAMTLARSEGVALVDEFTSVVNRDVAKATSNAVGKWVRRESKRVIFATCHDDVFEWLQPDWVYSAETGILEKKTSRGGPKSSWMCTDAIIVRGRYLRSITI